MSTQQAVSSSSQFQESGSGGGQRTHRIGRPNTNDLASSSSQRLRGSGGCGTASHCYETCGDMSKKVEVTFGNVFFRNSKKKTYKNNCSQDSHRNVKEQLLIDKLKHMGT